ncbi:MAG TPA: hypothetical protein PL131_07210 [Methylotenera sp.]|nr:hypothetical protein [Methylotenera sp.]HPH05648.1 hypothetical protein [Methylotenera sp.]HPN01328.1 hypothetical protein [Methylotenera sp.]
MIVYDDGPTGIIDRIVGALLAFFFCFITVFLFPMFLVLKFAFKWHLTHPYFLFKLSGISFSILFFFWAGLISVLALIYGALNGTTSTILMLSHLWGTSNDTALTQKIWAVIILGGIITAVIYSNLMAS